jgi:hypothetical protein
MPSIVIGERRPQWPAHVFIVFVLGLIAGAALCDGPPPAAGLTDAGDTYGDGCIERQGEHCECWPAGVRP